MPLTVLSGPDVNLLLRSLSRDDITQMQHSLAEALHAYSTATQEDGCCAMHQPPRTSISLKPGTTTLFMPATTSHITGMKIVTLAECNRHADADAVEAAPSTSLPLRPSESNSSSSPSMSSSSPSVSFALNSSPSASFSSDSRSTVSTTSTKRTSSSSPGSSIRKASSGESASGRGKASTSSKLPFGTGATSPRGSVTLLDNTGAPVGIINAEELTAFRTALAATMLFTRRRHVETLTVFGAGRQAYWHIRLSLLLRGSEIKRVNIITRSFEHAQPLLTEFYSTDQHDWRSGTKFSLLSAEYGEYGRLLKEEVRKADVIFCCTPSTNPLFPPEYLTSSEGRKKGRYISAIGSYKPNMCELHPDILRQATAPPHSRHHHKHASQGGVIVVDSLDACLRDAGEVIQAELGPEQLVEVGELVMLKRMTMRELERDTQPTPHDPPSSSSKDKHHGRSSSDGGLLNWLVNGNVIYKSVGMGLMDLVVGADLVNIANERGVGTCIDDF